MNRLMLLAVAVPLIGAGVTLRLGHFGLPLAIRHFGGGFLWGAVIYVVTAAIRPPQWGRPASLLAALVIIAAVESFRLVHAPALDSFRSTLAGQWLLGHLFSPWNLIADGLGAAFVALLSKRLL